MFLLDRFFDGTFFTYGIEVMSFADRDQVMHGQEFEAVYLLR